MILIINGEKKEFKNNSNLKEVIEELKIGNKVMAAAVNMKIIKKQDWQQNILYKNDIIELLQFVGGG